MKIMTDREYKRRIREETEQRMKELEDRRWQAQQIEDAERHMAKTLDRFKMEWDRRLARIEHALGLDCPTCSCGDDIPMAKPMDTSL